MSEPAEISALRDSSTELRRLAALVEEVAAEVVAYDRPDVWHGLVAAGVSEDLDDIRSRLTHPVMGSTTQLHAAAVRLLARADVLAASCVSCPP